MRRLIAAALVLPFFLVGCGGSTDVDEPPIEHISGKIDRGGNTDLLVYKFTIDGTTCVAMSGNRRGGLSCDWGN